MQFLFFKKHQLKEGQKKKKKIIASDTIFFKKNKVKVESLSFLYGYIDIITTINNYFLRKNWLYI